MADLASLSSPPSLPPRDEPDPPPCLPPVQGRDDHRARAPLRTLREDIQPREEEPDRPRLWLAVEPAGTRRPRPRWLPLPALLGQGPVRAGDRGRSHQAKDRGRQR